MHDDDLEDDEDWYDQDDSLDDEETIACPECGGPISEIADRCPACGYWLLKSDRHRLSRHVATPTWVKLTAVVLLLVMLVGLATFLF